MKRLERLTSLLSQLQSRRYSPVSRLAESFNISERTVYRDLKSLEAAGVPISFEKDQGYYILDRHFLPPLAFTPAEARAFVFAGALAQKYTDHETFAHFSSALEKIRAALRDYQLEDVEELQNNVKAYIDEKYSPRHLATADRACRDKQLLELEYVDNQGRSSHREVEPIGLSFYSQNWHLIAYCRLRQDFRDFVLSRVVDLKVTTQNFTPRLSLDGYIQKIQKETTS